MGKKYMIASPVPMKSAGIAELIPARLRRAQGFACDSMHESRFFAIFAE